MSFDLDFSRGKIFVIVGKQASGKSFTLRNLMYQFSKDGIFQFGQVFSGTTFNSDYEFMPEGAVDSNYSEAALERYIGKLRAWMEKNKGKKPPPNFLILDDILGKMRPRTAIFQQLISTYRHYHMSVFIVSQYMVANVSTLLRELTDVAILFKSKFKNTKESLFNAFGQMCEDQDEFERYFTQATKEKHAALLYFAEKDTKEEAYLSFKAPSDDKPFKLKFTPVKF